MNTQRQWTWILGICFIIMTLITCSSDEYSSHIIHKKKLILSKSNPVKIAKAKKILKDLSSANILNMFKPTNSDTTLCPKPEFIKPTLSSPNDSITVSSNASLDLTSIPVEAEKLFHGAEIVSKEHFTYGKFVARMKPAHVRGTVSAFFLYNTENQEEFDVEILGGHEKIVPTIHPCRIYKDVHLNPQILEEFHDYTLEWTPDYLRWSIDEIPIFELIINGNYSSKKRIILSTSVTKGWDGDIDFKNWKEHKVSYAYVKYYPYLGAEAGFAPLPSWEDNFEESLDIRWGRTSTNGPSPFSYTEHSLNNITQANINGQSLLELLLTRKKL